jgi:methionyl-tRNA formyltransferase
MKSNFKFVFFGTSEVSRGILEVLLERGLIPSLIVSTPDKPVGSGLALSATPSKAWAEIHGIPVIEPSSLRSEDVQEKLANENADIFIVVDYGKILPRNIFELPPHGTLNIHYSLLPKWRGASPIQATIQNDNEAGITIMEISEGLDEGAVIAQEKIEVPQWPPRFSVLRDLMIRRAGELLADILPDYIEGRILPTPQDSSQATYCGKLSKEDGLVDLAADAEANLRKVRALSENPGTYMFFKDKNDKEIRIKIKDAEIIEGEFTPTRVVPEGKREMSWQDFLRGKS